MGNLRAIAMMLVLVWSTTLAQTPRVSSVDWYFDATRWSLEYQQLVLDLGLYSRDFRPVSMSSLTSGQASDILRLISQSDGLKNRSISILESLDAASAADAAMAKAVIAIVKGVNDGEYHLYSIRDNGLSLSRQDHMDLYDDAVLHFEFGQIWYEFYTIHSSNN